MVQTLAAKAVVGTLSYQLYMLMENRRNLAALFVFLCIISFGIYCLYSLATYAKAIDPLVQYVEGEIRNPDRAEQHAEMRIDGAANATLQPGASGENVGRMLRERVDELTRTARLDLSGCRISLSDGDDPTESLKNAIVLLNETLGMEKEDGAEEYPLQLREDLPPTTEGVTRWNELVDLLDRYGQLRRAEVELADAEETFKAQKITAEYRKNRGDAVFKQLLAADKDFYSNPDSKLAQKLIEKSSSSKVLAKFRTAVEPFKQFATEHTSSTGKKFGGIEVSMANFHIIAALEQAKGYSEIIRDSLKYSVESMDSIPKFVHEGYAFPRKKAIGSEPGEYVAYDTMAPYEYNECTLAQALAVILYSDLHHTYKVKQNITSTKVNAGKLIKGQLIGVSKAISSDQWNNLNSAILALKQEIRRIFSEEKIYGGETGIGIILRAQKEYDEIKFREITDGAHRELELQRAFWALRPTEKPENAEKLLSARANGLFEDFPNPQKLPDGTKTWNPASFLADRLRQVTRLAKSGGPIQIDPNTKDIAGELNRKLRLSGNSAIVCLPYVFQKHRKEIDDFIAEFNRYSFYFYEKDQLENYAVREISNSLFKEESDAKCLAEKFCTAECGERRNKAAAARIRGLQIPSPDCEGESPTKGVLRLRGSADDFVKACVRQAVDNFPSHLQSFPGSGKSFPKYEKGRPIEYYVARLGSEVVLEGDGKGPITQKLYEVLLSLYEEMEAIQERAWVQLQRLKVAVPRNGGATAQMPLAEAYVAMTGPARPNDTDEIRQLKGAFEEARNAYDKPTGAATV
ncbi:MAG: hypothetical protein LBB14_02945 [Puniceicoccales bacterium]|jgi:hypothetical protein|nr:hypothetical protein [Puniceicoccales bacterium]